MLILEFAKTHENAEDEITQTHATSVRAKSGRLMVPAALDVHVYYNDTGFACTRDEAALCDAWSCPCMEDMDVHARQSCGEAAMPRKASCLELLVRARRPRRQMRLPSPCLPRYACLGEWHRV